MNFIAFSSLVFEPYVFVRRGIDVAGDEPDARLLDPRPDAVERNVLPDGRDHHLFVDELLDVVQDRLALPAIELARLLPKEPIDVEVAAVDVRPTAHHQRLDSGGRVTEGAVAALDETAEFLLDPPLLECGSLDRAKLHANADGVEIVDHRLTHVGQRSIAEIVARVESAGIARVSQKLSGLGGIVPVTGRLPVELEGRGHQTPGDPGEAE